MNSNGVKRKSVNRNVRLLAKQLHEYEQNRFEFLKRFYIKGFLAWQVIKRPLFYSLIRDSYNFEAENGRSATKAKEYLGALLLFPFRLAGLRMRKKPCVFIMSSELVKYEKDGLGRDINNFADHWYSYQPAAEVIYVENSSGKKDPANGVIMPDIDLSFISPLVRKLIKLKNGNSWNRASVNAIATDLSNHSGIEAGNPELFEEKIANVASKFIFDYYIYRFIFRVLRTKVLVVTDAVGSGVMAAAIRSKIKVIENQHGHFDRYKPDYIMSRQHLAQVRRNLVLPDVIAVFGPYFKRFLVDNSLWNDNEVVPVGNIRIDMYRSKKTEEDQFTQILIPTQWTVFNETMVLLNDLLSLFSKHRIKIIIKPHPREPQKHINAFAELAGKNENIRLADAAESIYALFIQSHMVIGFDSTSLYESVALNIPTITMATDVSTQGIHTFGDRDELLLRSVRIAKPEEIGIILEHWFNDTEFRETWMSDVRKASYYLYSDNCIENCRKLMNDIKSLN